MSLSVSELAEFLYQTNAYQNVVDQIRNATSRSTFLQSVEYLVLDGMKRVDRLRIAGLEKKKMVLRAVFGILDTWVATIEQNPLLRPVMDLMPDIASTWIDTVVAVRKGKIDYKTGAWTLLVSCCKPNVVTE